MTEQYRFESGSLFEYDSESNCYIHVYKSYEAKTKAQAIANYEESRGDYYAES